MSIEPVPGELEEAAGVTVDGSAAETGTESRNKMTDRFPARPFALLWLCGFTYFLATGVVLPLLPRFVKDTMHQGNVMVGLAVGLIAVSAVLARPFAARLADRRGRRPVATIGAFTTAVSFALYPFPNLAVLIPARLLTGVAGALFFTAAATMVTELAPSHRRGEAVSYFSVAVYLGMGLGPVIGVWATSQWSIRVGFIAAALCGLIAVLTTFWLAETGKRVEAQAGTGGSAGRRISTVALLSGCVLALCMAANVTFGSFMPLYAGQLRTGAAGVYLAYTAVLILVRVFGARIPDVLGPGTCGTAATVVIAAGMAAVSLSGTVWGLYAGSVTLAIGLSLLYPALMKLVVDRAPEAERATAVATFTAFFDVANGFGGLAAGVAASAGGYRASFGATAVAALLALAIFQAFVLRAAPGRTPEG